MLHEIASKITEQLVKNNTDDQDMIDIYIYGTECILNSSITTFFHYYRFFFHASVSTNLNLAWRICIA